MFGGNLFSLREPGSELFSPAEKACDQRVDAVKNHLLTKGVTSLNKYRVVSFDGAMAVVNMEPSAVGVQCVVLW